MSRRRFVTALLGAAGVVLLALGAYLAGGDLGRHKTRIEAFVTQRIGRPFAIDGAFQLRLLPSIEILAERVRVGNAAWGSAPQMLQIGRVSASIGVGSLIWGPLDVRRLELSDVSAVLEKDADGRRNWVFGDATGTTQVPAVIRHAELRGVRVAYREAGEPERVALVETLSGSMRRTGWRRVEGELATARLDLTPFLPGGRRRAKKPKPEAERFVFGESPLPLGALKGIDARLRLAAAEVKLGAGSLRDVEATLSAGDGRLAFEGRAQGGVDGTLAGSATLAPAGDGRADLSLKVAAHRLRAGFEAGRAIAADQVPPTSVEANLRARGASARQMASSADGRVLVTQAAGKIESSLVAMLGADILGELAGKVNPFSARDPYMRLDCTVARADIVDGRARIEPLLVQSDKVAIVASGEIDLRTEKVAVSFSTRPRSGIGISAGLLTNPFVELAGTLANPSLGVGAKGAASGAVAAATGGLSVVAQGLFDRLRGAQDLCKTTLDEATAGR